MDRYFTVISAKLVIMTPETEKEIVLLLLRDDLVNTKLVDALCKMEFSAEVFYLNTSSVIFRLMGIDLDNPDNEPIYKEYLKRCSAAIYVKMKGNQSTFDEMAQELYDFLMFKKKQVVSRGRTE